MALSDEVRFRSEAVDAFHARIERAPGERGACVANVRAVTVCAVCTVCKSLVEDFGLGLCELFIA